MNSKQNRLGKCSRCNHKVRIEDFRDNDALKEFCAMQICQNCQDIVEFFEDDEDVLHCYDIDPDTELLMNEMVQNMRRFGEDIAYAPVGY